MPRRRAKAIETGHMESAGMMRWLLTYADMITLLLGLFILLFAISKVEQEKFQTLMAALGEAFGKSKIIKKGDGALPYRRTNIPSVRPYISPRERLEALEEKMKKVIEEKKLEEYVKIKKEKEKIRITITAEGGRLPEGEKLKDKPLFDRGKADIRSEWYPILDTISAIIINSGSGAIVEGHTCDLPIRTYQYPSNWELSVGRASSVIRYFIERGVDPKMLSAAGYADTKPVAPNISEENRKKNRRVEIIIGLKKEVIEETL